MVPITLASIIAIIEAANNIPAQPMDYIKAKTKALLNANGVDSRALLLKYAHIIWDSPNYPAARAEFVKFLKVFSTLPSFLNCYSVYKAIVNSAIEEFPSANPEMINKSISHKKLVFNIDITANNARRLANRDEGLGLVETKNIKTFGIDKSAHNKSNERKGRNC
uniref:Pentatricopeptide repeat-containing protein n=1 Tax=Rhabditophanes sp. KR3021 TaxID=114890 RepID=A0AC35TTA0_9BILA